MTNSTGQAMPLHLLIQELTAGIFKAEENRLLAQELATIQENARLEPRAHDGFRFLGELYSTLAWHLRRKGQYGPLHGTLVPRMRELVATKQEIAFDKDRVKQAFALILSGCESPQDQLDALPNSLHDSYRTLVPAAVGLTRSREEAWTVRHNPRGQQQYLKLRDKIEFYNISRLLY